MLNAAIKACPVRGGKVVSFDAAKVKGMKGVAENEYGRDTRGALRVRPAKEQHER